MLAAPTAIPDHGSGVQECTYSVVILVETLHVQAAVMRRNKRKVMDAVAKNSVPNHAYNLMGRAAAEASTHGTSSESA